MQTEHASIPTLNPRALLPGETIEVYTHPELGAWGVIGKPGIEIDGKRISHVPSGNKWDRTVFMLFTGCSNSWVKTHGAHIPGRIRPERTATRTAREGKLKADGERNPPTKFEVLAATFLASWVRGIGS